MKVTIKSQSCAEDPTTTVAHATFPGHLFMSAYNHWSLLNCVHYNSAVLFKLQVKMVLFGIIVVDLCIVNWWCMFACFLLNQV